MKTTEQWWDEVSNDPEKMIDWLKDQYHGEVTAADRIAKLVDDYPEIPYRYKWTLQKIAREEAWHANWIKTLLVARGIKAEVLTKEERYWNTVLPVEQVSFERMCAIGYHAETMRLDRILLLANDPRFHDIATVFQRIWPDEEYHQRLFKEMSTPEDIEATRAAHESGKNALGLIA